MRAGRLLSLMLLLQARGRMTAAELSQTLEVSERTIYRDIDALSGAGVPVYTQSGTNGGIFLDEHYRVSLTGLSRAETLSLFISSDAGPLHDIGLADAVEESLLKLFAALPDMHRDAVTQMRQRLYIDPAGWFQRADTAECLPLLQQAVWEDRKISAIYQPVEGESHPRTLDAIALVAKANVWYLIGRKANGDLRNYRVRRLKQVALIDGHFQRDPAFDLEAYWKDSCEQFLRQSSLDNPPYYVRLRVHPDGFWFFPGFMEERYEQIAPADADGWTELRVRFESFWDAHARLIGLGTWVNVLDSPALIDAILNTARAILAANAGET
ncbi:MAG: WYL domain-containing protein [Aggregatilineales bacterium]